MKNNDMDDISVIHAGKCHFKIFGFASDFASENLPSQNSACIVAERSANFTYRGNHEKKRCVDNAGKECSRCGQ